MKRTSFALLVVMAGCSPTLAQDAGASAAPAPFTVSRSVQLLTGDTWSDGDRVFRLYGVQSCLRGTTAEAPDGQKIDCGNASLAHLAALFGDAEVTCQPMGYALDKAVFVVCAAQLGGATIDVGTALISTGYAFAATTTKGEALNGNYLVAEVNAKRKRTGLWNTAFQHPVRLLLKHAARTKQ